MNIGYIRVSTKDQLTIRQEILMRDLGVERIYIDKVSGKNTDRPQLKEMMSYVREGDLVIVESISRFARNTKDLLNLVEILENKGVKFVSKKESIDTSTAQGRFMLTVFGAIAELEREYTLDRQREGINAMPMDEHGRKISLRTGRYTGRPNINFPDNWDAVYSQWKNKEIKSIEAMKLLNLRKTTFYKLLKEYESNTSVLHV